MQVHPGRRISINSTIVEAAMRRKIASHRRNQIVRPLAIDSLSSLLR